MSDSKDRVAWTPQEFCHRHSIGLTTFYEEVKAGRLKIKKLGRRTLVLDDDGRAWLATLPDADLAKQTAS